MNGKVAKLIRRASKGLEGNDDRWLKQLWRATPAPLRRKLRGKLRPGRVPAAILRCSEQRILDKEPHRCIKPRQHLGQHRACGVAW